MHNYFYYLGERYYDLMHQSSFKSLISGNKISKMDGDEDDFLIQDNQRGLELQFITEDKKLNLIIVSNPSYFTGRLNGVTDKHSVRKVMGAPSNTMEEKTVPVLGLVGAWDKYNNVESGYIQVLYELGSDKIKSIFYGL